MDILKPYSDLIALAALLVSLLAAVFAGRSAIAVERLRRQFALREKRVAALREFQEFMREHFSAMDRIAAGRKGDTMDKKETLAAVEHLRTVNNRYREISYVFSKESQELLNRTLDFIEEHAGTAEAFEQLSNLPALYQERVARDLGHFFS